jgi:hypothetical protein
MGKVMMKMNIPSAVRPSMMIWFRNWWPATPPAPVRSRSFWATKSEMMTAAIVAAEGR